MTRSSALVLAALMLAVGLLAGAWIDDFFDQDACLDHGGAWRDWYCEIDGPLTI